MVLVAVLVSACGPQPTAAEIVETALEEAAAAEVFHSRVTASSGGAQLIEEVVSVGEASSFDMTFIKEGQRREMLTVRRFGDEVFVRDSREPDPPWVRFTSEDVPDSHRAWIERSRSPYSGEDPVGVASSLPDGFTRVDGAPPAGTIYEAQVDGAAAPMTVALDEQGRVREIVIRLGEDSVTIEILSYGPDATAAPERPEIVTQ